MTARVCAACAHVKNLIVRRARRDVDSLMRFLRSCVDELRRVKWATRQETGTAFIVVVCSSAVAGALLFGLDQLLASAVDVVFG